jgi:hypothetical protein
MLSNHREFIVFKCFDICLKFKINHHRYSIYVLFINQFDFTLVFTVNLTLSLSFNASEISIFKKSGEFGSVKLLSKLTDWVLSEVSSVGLKASCYKKIIRNVLLLIEK